MSPQVLQNRQFLVILTIVFLGFLGISIPYLIFPALFLNVDYLIVPVAWGQTARSVFLGITLAAYPMGQFIGSPILGSLADDYGRKGLLSASLVIAAICNLLTGFAITWQNLALLILSRFLAGVMEGNIAIARAMATDLTTISRHKTFGRINAAASIAFLIGPLLGGMMTDKNLHPGFTLSTPFYAICTLFFFLAALAAIILENSKKSRAQKQSFLKRINIYQRLLNLFDNKRLKFLLITSTCFTLAVDIFYEFGPVYLTLKWSLGPPQLIFYNAILCFALAVGNGWLPDFLSQKISNRVAISYATLLFPMLIFAMLFVNSPAVMMLLFGLSGLLIGVVVTLLTVKISNAVSDEAQGEVMGVQIALRVLGDAMICLLGGLLLLFSIKLVLTMSIVIALLCFSYYQKNR